MTRLRGTKPRVPIVIIFLAFTLICSLSTIAQDKLLTNSTSQNNTANAAAVDCYDTSNPCVAGQYYHSDGAQWFGTWNSTFVTASPRKFGGWKAYASGDVPAAGSIPSNPCWGCHHGNSTSGGNAIGANYMTMGHKNMLRKVVPGQAPWSTAGIPLFSDTSFADPSGNTYNWTNGTITLLSNGNTYPLYYVFGWNEDPYNLFQGGGEGALGFNYSCGRCHTVGYRFDANGPEPTSVVLDPVSSKYVPDGKISDANLSRYPGSGKAGDTSSWYLSGIQCERCHKADMQFKATQYNPNYNVSGTPTPTQGRISHLVSLDSCSTMPSNPDGSPIFTLDGACVPPPATPVYIRPLPNVPVNQKSTALCIECHRQEIATGVAGVQGSIHPAQLPGQTLGIAGVPDGAFKSSGSCSISHTPAYNYNDCIAAGGTFGPYKPSMSHGANGAQAFLNSPHAQFIGTFDQTTQNSTDLSVTLTGTYNSFFTDSGQALGAKTGTGPGGLPLDTTKNAGCAGCHDVHNTLLEVNATNVAPPLTHQCTDCHSEHAGTMAHPTGQNTPYPNGYGGVTSLNGMANFTSGSCVVCHMAGASGAATYHYFRINEDPAYSTFPSAATYYTTYGSGKNAQPNTYPITVTNPVTYASTPNYPAVALDVDIACGQCHIGGDGTTNPYGLTPPTSGIPAFSRAFLASKAVNMHNTAAPAPTFNPPYPYNGPTTTLTISDPAVAEGNLVAIFYTTDGSTPSVAVGAGSAFVPGTAATQKCATNPCSIAVNGSETVYALAAGPNSYNYSPSPVVGGYYTIPKVPTPTISPTGGTYNYGTTATITLSDITAPAGTAIYYTTDGSIPTTSSNLYSAPIPVMTATIRAIAAATGYSTSAAAGPATFTVKLAAPVFSNAGGAKYPGTYSLSAGVVNVLLTDTDTSATICYRYDGTAPTASNGTCGAGSTALNYSGSWPTFALPNAAGVYTVKAIASAANYTTSVVTSGTYTLK